MNCLNDFSMFAGDSKTLEIVVLDDDGSPVDISAATAIRWHLARSVKSPSVVAKSLDSGIGIAGEAGVFMVELEPADTESLVGHFYHEAEIIIPTDKVATVLTGNVTIRPTNIKPASP